VTGSRDGRGKWTTYAYDAADRLTTRVDALGNTTTHHYDDAGNLTKTTDALNGVTTLLYDAANRQTGMIDPLGRRTTSAYDAAGPSGRPRPTTRWTGRRRTSWPTAASRPSPTGGRYKWTAQAPPGPGGQIPA